MVASPPALRALSQRAGKVYGAADNFGDGYALGTSTDEGTTWQALMTYADVKAINPCLKAACQTSCEAQVSVSLWTEDVCTTDAPTGAGGSSGAGGTGAGGAGMAGRAGSGGAGGAGGAEECPPRETRRLQRGSGVARRCLHVAAARDVAGRGAPATRRPSGFRLGPHPDQIEVAAADRLCLGGRGRQPVEGVQR